MPQFKTPPGITPAPGFNWALVGWSKPNSMPSPICSYCFSKIPGDTVPLILFKKDGACCRFCSDCMATWWGFPAPR